MGEANERAVNSNEITTLRVYVDVAEKFRQIHRELAVANGRDLNQSEVVDMLITIARKSGAPAASAL